MAALNGKHIAEKIKPEIVYVYDPLCGWCYGFSPVITQVKEKYGSSLDFMVLTGGMVVGDKAGPIGKVAAYIKNAYKAVEASTGVVFGERFLKDVLEKGDAHFSSEPAARALAVFRMQKLADALSYAAKLQKAIYYEGVHPDDLKRFAAIAGEFGLDPEIFEKQCLSAEVTQIIENEFQMVASMGVRAYPYLMLRKGDSLEPLTQGYCSFEKLEQMLMPLS